MKKIFTLISVALLCLSASAQVNLATAIEDAVKASSDEYCSVFLDHTKEYVLDSNVDLGLQKAVIWGCGAKVTVKGEGQLSTQTYLQVRSVNFLCAEATKAIIALSATPDESLKINDETSAIKFEGANQKVYWIDNQVSVVLCNFVDLGQSLIYANKQPYALANLKIDQCVVQLRGANVDPVINWYGSNPGAIKNIVLTNNTIYNVSQDNTSSYTMIRMGNDSNARPQRIWGTGAFSRFQMYNNTICLGGQKFANNFPNIKDVYLTWKKNIFINTPYLQKIGGNQTREFTNADNVLYATEGFTIDNTDKEKYGTVEDLAIVPPTESLNIDNIFTLKNVFAPKFETVATNSQYGDPRWVTPFKDVVAKTPGCGYEVVLGPDMLDLKTLTLVGNCNESDLGKVKPGIDTANYPWIKYVRGDDKNILSNGQHEAQKSNRKTDINPTTGVQGETLQVKGNNGSVDCPVISGEWNKWMVVFVKNLTALKIFATGSASSTVDTKVQLVVKAYGTDGSVVEASTAEGTIWGKGKASDVCQVELNPEIGYMVEISSVSPNNEKNDIQITGLQLHGVDTTPFPVCHAPETKAPGTNYEVLNLSNALTVKTKDGADKYAIDDVNYPWVNYNYQASILDDGTCEVSRGGIYSSIDPVTEAELDVPVYICDDNDPIKYNGSPKVEIGYTKTEDGLALNLYPKTLTFGIQSTTRAALILTGGGSNTNVADVVVKDNTGKTVKTICSPEMPGKSNKPNLTNTQSKLVEIPGLDPNKCYSITVEPCMDVAQINGTSIKGPAVYVVALHLTGTDLSIAPVEEEPGMGDATGIENVETAPVQNGRIYNILGQEVKSAKGLVIKNGKKYIVR